MLIGSALGETEVIRRAGDSWLAISAPKVEEPERAVPCIYTRTADIILIQQTDVSLQWTLSSVKSRSVSGTA